jgi:hypothetical protein
MLTTLAILTAAPAFSVHDTIVAMDRTSKGFAIYTPVDSAPGKYTIWELNTQSLPGMGVMKEAEIRSFTGYDDGDAAVGGAWYAYTLNGMYEGRARWSKNPGAFMEFTFTTEPGQVVSLINFKTTNGGIGSVTIDGDPNLANLLPESNGMRVIDFYSAQGPTPNLFKNNRTPIKVADSLPGGTHTLRINFTGLKNPASSDTRIYVDGLAVYNGTAVDETVREDFFVLGTTALTSGGAWESVFKVGSKFYGTAQHGNEALLSSALYVDGNLAEMGLYETLTGDTFNFLMETRVSVEGAGPVALNSRNYRFACEGLDLGQRTEWTRALPMTHIYTAMWPILDGPETSAEAYLDPFGEQGGLRNRFDLTLNDLFFKGGFDAERAYITNARNARTFTFEVTDLDSNLHLPRFWVWDLGAPSYNKLYFQRQTDRYHARQGETWTSTTKFRYYYDPARMGGA